MEKRIIAMEDLAQYNGDVEHDMWVDFAYHEFRRNRESENKQSSQNTCELSEYFEDSDLDAYVNNLNDWY